MTIRKHSKFSASGAERWFQCQGSVAISEGLPDKESIYSKEGTRAHNYVEGFLEDAIRHHWNAVSQISVNLVHAKEPDAPREMTQYAKHAVDFILGVGRQHPGSEILVESRVFLDFIHPEAFGTLDSAVVDYFGTLHVFDYKYGKGVPVSPVANLQMLFYSIAAAHMHQWNFKKARLWIIQPRIPGYEGPVWWDLSIPELRRWAELFKLAIERVEKNPNRFVEGVWCHWCKAKSVCPLKREGKQAKAAAVFGF